MIVLETDRLIVRQWVSDDWLRIRPVMTDPRALEYIGNHQRRTDEQIRFFVDSGIEVAKTRGWILWPLILKEDSQLIGFAGFNASYAPDVEIGWRLRPEYWGRGLATEAGRALLDYGFRTFRFPRVISVAQTGNAASTRIMEKLGMKFDRRFVADGVEVVSYAIANPAADASVGAPVQENGSDHFDAVGQRVAIRRPRAQDCEEFIALMQASEEFHRPWSDPPKTASRFDEYLKTRQPPTDDGFLICERGTGRIAGVININCIVGGTFQSAYLGYYVGAPFARRGYMVEGMKLVTRYAFDEIKLHRVEANVQPGNIASVALVRKCGFRKEGFSPRYLKIFGDWRDHERWALLADEAGK